MLSLRGKADECAVFVSAQNNSNGMLEKNDGNLRKHMLRRRANDLLGKERHENVVHPLVLQHEVLEVLYHDSPVPRVAQDAGTHVEGVHYRDARGFLSDDLHRHADRE